MDASFVSEENIGWFNSVGCAIVDVNARRGVAGVGDT
jgi:hypothetical protein